MGDVVPPRVPLSARPLDRFYFVFLVVHLIATCLVDIQALFFMRSITPLAFRQIFEFAAREDPLLSNANAPLFAWFQSFIILEIAFQLPIFVLGARGLYNNSKTIYPLLGIYGASSATTTWACLATVLTMPGIKHQLPMLLASYVPFFLVPLAMAGDFTLRLTRMAADVQATEATKKLS